MRLNLRPYRIYWFAFMTLVVAPVLLVAFPAYFWFIGRGPDPQNLNLFFGGVGLMVGALMLVMYGPQFLGLWQKRRRFAELTTGPKRSDFKRNLQELDEIARTLGGSYPRRLKQLRDEARR